ncbi:MAG: alkaline phosphatase family protein, partial [Ignavibacteria bacterium]|nr:alkaline phosphatase family protein [Ignavibacteria bacterium]
SLLGRHFGPYPHSALRPVLETQNIFTRLREAGRSVCFANAFPQRFFDHMASKPTRLTVTTLSCNLSGVPLLRAVDLMEGRAVSADITGEGWAELGYPEIPVIEPEEAGRRLRLLTRTFDFVLFEYWKTDHAGHSMNREEASGVLTMLDRMLHGFITSPESENVLLVITSDHGNIEDISTKVHTRNPVPLALYGNGCRRIEGILSDLRGSDLTCITPAIIRYLLNDSGD